MARHCKQVAVLLSLLALNVSLRFACRPASRSVRLLVDKVINMSENNSEYITANDATFDPTVEGYYQMLQVPLHIPGGQRAYYEQRRRAIITELRALDTLLGRTQTIPRQER